MWLSRLRRVIAWSMLLGGLAVDALAWAGLVARHEPQLVLHLSTAALVFEGLNGVMFASKED